MTGLQTVLAIDTCGVSGTVALVQLHHDTAAVTFLAQREMGIRSASADLVPMIDALLLQASMKLGEVHALLVVNGPGSFTGVRVGLSTAKGLAHATQLPIVAISRLDVLASLAEGDALAVLDAGRGEFYARHRGDEWLATAAEIADVAAQGIPILVAEDSMKERLHEYGPTVAGPLDALAASRAARDRILRRQADALSSLDANYLRRSDAELFARLPRIG